VPYLLVGAAERRTPPGAAPAPRARGRGGSGGGGGGRGVVGRGLRPGGGWVMRAALAHRNANRPCLREPGRLGA
jgi:hypothetical protein